MGKTQDHMSLAEAVDRLSDLRAPARNDMASISTKSSSSWDLSTSFISARRMAAEGWDEKGRELWQQINALALKIEVGVSQHHDTSGDSVDIGRFLSGEPECMQTQTMAPFSAVQVVMNISARCDAPAEKLMNRGIAVAAVIHALQSAGRGVSLCIAESVARSESTHDTILTLQEFGDYINPARLAFWAAHPAALRRCIFRFNEQQEMEVRERFGFHSSGGYGTPRDLDSNRLPEGCVYIPFPETSLLNKQYSNPKDALRNVVREFAARGVPIEIDADGQGT